MAVITPLFRGTHAMTDLIIKLGYCYLLALALISAWRSCAFGLAIDRSGRCLHPILHAEYGLIVILSFIQTFLCVNLILAPVPEKTWWLPFICKQSSLVFYIVAINFMYWRLRTVLTMYPNGSEV